MTDLDDRRATTWTKDLDDEDDLDEDFGDEDDLDEDLGAEDNSAQGVPRVGR